ncbi:hypothetical protein SCHPADRAFT_895764 [Schizopora paradoxa]|uniref:Uncharacterized protein n=1 Tax=Schizopora paradoxa TaxID=27342 RepID=A0A0H2RMK0_9AGAM|nr:hypothetical protein SCHPADRAFT_895764 [Schizopora paradoxa]
MIVASAVYEVLVVVSIASKLTGKSSPGLQLPTLRIAASKGAHLAIFSNLEVYLNKSIHSAAQQYCSSTSTSVRKEASAAVWRALLGLPPKKGKKYTRRDDPGSGPLIYETYSGTNAVGDGKAVYSNLHICAVAFTPETRERAAETKEVEAEVWGGRGL